MKGAITFENVSFRYKDGVDEVLSGVNLSVRPGEYVALAGPSGVGKTTLCSLIPRFYEVTGVLLRLTEQISKMLRLKACVTILELYSTMCICLWVQLKRT